MSHLRRVRRRRRDLPARQRAARPGRRGPRRRTARAPYADLVGAFVVRDTDLAAGAAASPARCPWSCTGGAGQLAGPAVAGRAARAGRCAPDRDRAARPRRPRPATPAAWSPPSTTLARRIARRRRRRCTSSCPPAPAAAGWLAAADEVAAAELRLKFRTGGADGRRVPVRRRAGRVDRRGARPRDAVQVHGRAAPRGPAPRRETGFEHHGFLNVLVATRCSLDGGAVDDAVAGARAARRQPCWPTAADEADLAGARRWFTSFGVVQPSTRRLREDLADELGAGSMERRLVVRLDNLPYGVFSVAGGDATAGRRAASATRWSTRTPVDRARRSSRAPVAQRVHGARPRRSWAATRRRELLADESSAPTPSRIPLDEVTLHLPFEVADYVDFYASLHHATNVGRIFRPDGEPLTPNWRHLPIGYHGRAGTVVVSGTDVVRPRAAQAPGRAAAPSYGPSRRLDIEAELGFVVGVPTALGDAGAVRRLRRPRLRRDRRSTTGRRATSRPGSTCRSARSSASRSRPRSPRGSRRWPPSTRPGSTCPARTRSRCPTCGSARARRLRHRRRGGAQRRGRQPAAVRLDVLVARPDARPPDRQRRLAAHRRPVRSGTISGPEPDQRGSFLELSLGRHGAVRRTGTPSSRTATRSRCAPPRPARSAAGSRSARSPGRCFRRAAGFPG